MSDYSITWEAFDRLLIVKPIGFFSQEVFSSYRRKVLVIIDRVGAPFDTLVNMTSRVPQAADITARYRQLNQELATRGLRHMVVVGPSPLVKVQVKRLASLADPHFFSSVDEGRRWLRTT